MSCVYACMINPTAMLQLNQVVSYLVLSYLILYSRDDAVVPTLVRVRDAERSGERNPGVPR